MPTSAKGVSHSRSSEHNGDTNTVDVLSSGHVRHSAPHEGKTVQNAAEKRLMRQAQSADHITVQQTSADVAHHAVSASFEENVVKRTDPLAAKFGRGCNRYTDRSCEHETCPEWRNAQCEDVKNDPAYPPENGGNVDKWCVCLSGMCADDGACYADDRAAAVQQGKSILTKDGSYICPKYYEQVSDNAHCLQRASSLGLETNDRGPKIENEECVYGDARICRVIPGGVGNEDELAMGPGAGGQNHAEAVGGDYDDDYGGGDHPGATGGAHPPVERCKGATPTEGEGNAQCPAGAVPYERDECEALPGAVGGELAEPFEVAEPESPKGCYMHQGSGSGGTDEYFWNTDSTGAEEYGSIPYCRQCSDGSESTDKAHGGDHDEHHAAPVTTTTTTEGDGDGTTPTAKAVGFNNTTKAGAPPRWCGLSLAAALVGGIASLAPRGL